METEEKINAILYWASHNTWFDATFVESLTEDLIEYGSLTAAQENALDNIIKRFNIN